MNSNKNSSEAVVDALDPMDGISAKSAYNFVTDQGTTWVYNNTQGSMGAMASNDTGDASWVADVKEIWMRWVAEQEPDKRWSSTSECWNDFVQDRDGFTRSKIECVCRLPVEKFQSAREQKRVVSTSCNCNDSGIMRATIYLIKTKETS